MSTAFGSFLDSRIDGSPRTLALAAGDVACIALFVLLGERSHGVSVVDQPLVVLDTFAPFFIGWVVASLLVGAYAARAHRSLRAAAGYAAGSWAVAVAIGQSLRATSLFHGSAAPTFVVVSLLVGTALLVTWRVAATFLLR